MVIENKPWLELVTIMTLPVFNLYYLGLDGVALGQRGEPDGPGDGRGEPGLARPQQRLVDWLDGGASAGFA